MKNDPVFRSETAKCLYHFALAIQREREIDEVAAFTIALMVSLSILEQTPDAAGFAPPSGVVRRDDLLRIAEFAEVIGSPPDPRLN